MIQAPKDGWYDMFNGLRTPEIGVCASFEELVSEVIKKKVSMGIKIGSQKEEERDLIGRLYDSERISHKKSRCC
jgi:hypothetical protein